MFKDYVYVVRVATALIWAIFEIQISCTNLDFKIRHIHTHIHALVYFFLLSLSLFLSLYHSFSFEANFAVMLCIFVTKIGNIWINYFAILMFLFSSCLKCTKQLLKENFASEKYWNFKLLLHLVKKKLDASNKIEVEFGFRIFQDAFGHYFSLILVNETLQNIPLTTIP